MKNERPILERAAEKAAELGFRPGESAKAFASRKAAEAAALGDWIEEHHEALVAAVSARFR